ncbi:MAG: hypothetical protein IJ249_01610 [Paludibacteraceae bacterium]|nr:hypothetical protein [Paludibacteraceae bacterium]
MAFQVGAVIDGYRMRLRKKVWPQPRNPIGFAAAAKRYEEETKKGTENDK